MRTAMIDSPNPVLLDQYSRAFWAELHCLLLGQYKQPVAYHSNRTGLTRGNVLCFWNVEKH